MKLWVLRSDLSLSKKVCINKRQEPKPTQQLCQIAATDLLTEFTVRLSDGN